MAEDRIQATAMLSCAPDQANNSLVLILRDREDKAVRLEIPEAILAGLIVALHTQGSHLQPGSTGQMLNVTAARAFSISDGRTGLELTLEGSARLPLIFPRNTIAALGKSVELLEARSTQDPDAPSRH